AETERADDRVEALGRELERLGVAQPKVDPAPELGGACARLREHLAAEVDARQRDPGRIVREVAAGPDCELEHVALRLAAHPGPTVAEERSLAHGDLPVVVSRASVLETPNSFGLAVQRPRIIHPPPASCTAAGGLAVLRSSGCPP